MKILFYLDEASLSGTLLSWTLAEELRLRGHIVHYSKQPLLPKYDWVYGAGLNSWGAINTAKSVNAKCHIHLEGVAYWRIGLDSAIQWGYEQELTSIQINRFRKFYQAWMNAAYAADTCSVNGKNQVKAIENNLFEATLPNCHVLSCGADARYATTLIKECKEKYMITVSRLEPNKKVFMIAEALALLKKQGVDIPPWIIIGYGTKEQVSRLANILNPDKINCRIIHCYGAEKWYWIKNAGLMLCGWMAIPISEGMLCNTPVLSFDHPDMVEMYDDTIFWAKDNDIVDYANQLNDILVKTSMLNDVLYHSDIIKKTVAGKAELLLGNLYACTQEQAAEKHEKIFMEGM